MPTDTLTPDTVDASSIAAPTDLQPDSIDPQSILPPDTSDVGGGWDVSPESEKVAGPQRTTRLEGVGTRLTHKATGATFENRPEGLIETPESAKAAGRAKPLAVPRSRGEVTQSIRQGIERMQSNPTLVAGMGGTSTAIPSDALGRMSDAELQQHHQRLYKSVSDEADSVIKSGTAMDDNAFNKANPDVAALARERLMKTASDYVKANPGGSLDNAPLARGISAGAEAVADRVRLATGSETFESQDQRRQMDKAIQAARSEANPYTTAALGAVGKLLSPEMVATMAAGAPVKSAGAVANFAKGVGAFSAEQTAEQNLRGETMTPGTNLAANAAMFGLAHGANVLGRAATAGASVPTQIAGRVGGNVIGGVGGAVGTTLAQNAAAGQQTTGPQLVAAGVGGLAPAIMGAPEDIAGPRREYAEHVKAYLQNNPGAPIAEAHAFAKEITLATPEAQQKRNESATESLQTIPQDTTLRKELAHEAANRTDENTPAVPQPTPEEMRPSEHGGYVESHPPIEESQNARTGSSPNGTGAMGEDQAQAGSARRDGIGALQSESHNAPVGDGQSAPLTPDTVEEASVKPKEPWQMTADAFRDANREKYTKDLTKVTGDAYRLGKTRHILSPGETIPPVGNVSSSAKLPLDAKVGDVVPGISGNHRVESVGRIVGGKQTPPDLMEVYRAATDAHRAVVEKAITEGNPVPPEVLKDYPDLKQSPPANSVGTSKAPEREQAAESKSASDILLRHGEDMGVIPGETEREQQPSVHPDAMEGANASQRQTMRGHINEDRASNANADLNAAQISRREQGVIERFGANKSERLQTVLDHFKSQMAKTGDMRMAKLVAYAEAEGTGAKATKPVDSFNDGDKFTLGGRKFKVIVDEHGTHFEDDDLTIVNPKGKMKYDAGSLTKGPQPKADEPFAPPETKTTGPQGSLLGERHEGSSIGSKTGSMFGDTSQGPANELEAQQQREAASARAQVDKDQTGMFDRDTLHRETSPDAARDILKADKTKGTEVNPATIHFASDRALATGQGDNAGAHLEFEPGFNATEKTSKPGSEFAASQGLKEYTAAPTQKEMRDNLRAVEVPKAIADDTNPLGRNAGLTRELKRLEAEGWTRRDTGETARFEKPEAGPGAANVSDPNFLANEYEQNISGRTTRQKIIEGTKDALSNDVIPKLTRAGVQPEAVALAKARDAVMPKVRDIQAKVFPDKYRDKEFMGKVIDIINKDNVLAGYDAFYKRAQDAIAKGNATGRDANLRKAEAIEKTHDIHAITEEVLAAKNDPAIAGAIERWKRFVNPEMDRLYNEMKRLDPNQPQEPRGKVFGARINLVDESHLAEWQEALADPEKSLPDTPSSNFHRRPDVKRDQFDQSAAFTGKYATDPDVVLGSSFGKRIPEVAKLRFIEALQKKGVAWESAPGEEIPKELNGEPVSRVSLRVPETDPETGATKIVDHGLYVQNHLLEETKAVLGLKDKSPVPAMEAVGKVLNKIQLTGVVDLAAHTFNLERSIANAPGASNDAIDLLRKFPGVGSADAIGRVVKTMGEIFSDTPEIRQEISRMADAGLLRGYYPHKGVTKLGGEAISHLDFASRVILNRFFTNLVERGRAQDTPENRYKFVSQVGEYNRRLIGPLTRTLRDLGMSPFIIAGKTFNQAGRRLLLGDPGFRGATKLDSAKARAIMLSGLAAVVTLPMMINAITTGSPMGRPGVPIGAIDLGSDDDKGNHKVLDLMQLQGYRRGMRVTGLGSLIEGLRQGKDTQTIAGNAIADVFRSLLHPYAGPAPAFAFKTVTGMQPDIRGKMEAQRIPGIDSTSPRQLLENARAATESQNPLIYGFLKPWLQKSGIDKTPQEGIGESIAKGTLAPVEGAVGYKSVKPGTSAAEDMAKRLSSATFGSSGLTPDTAQKLAMKQSLADELRGGNPKAIADAVKEGKLTQREADNLTEKTTSPALEYNTKNLSLPDAMKVWDAGTKDERDRIAALIEKKAGSSDLPPDEKAALLMQHEFPLSPDLVKQLEQDRAIKTAVDTLRAGKLPDYTNIPLTKTAEVRNRARYVSDDAYHFSKKDVPEMVQELESNPSLAGKKIREGVTYADEVAGALTRSRSLSIDQKSELARRLNKIKP